MKKFLTAVLIIVVLLVGGASAAGGYFYAQNQSQRKINEVQKKINEIQNQIKKRDQNIKELEKKIEAQKKAEEPITSTETRGQIVSPKGFFKIDLPRNGDTISSPVRVTGWANVFEAQFQARVKDASGTVLGTASVMASAGAPTGGTFDTMVAFSEPSQTQEGTVEIYDLSPKDGSILDIVTIKVTLKGK